MNVTEQITSLNGRIAYCNEALASGELQAWEAKEYSSLLAEHISEVARLQAIVDENPSLF